MAKLSITPVLLVISVLTLLVFSMFRYSVPTQEGAHIFSVWDAKTASFKEYASYEKMEQEQDAQIQKEIEEYDKATQGTIVERLKNIHIPSYADRHTLVQLQNGEITVLSEKSSEFPEGVFEWAAHLVKNIHTFAVGDFNNDGKEDVAHMIGYTGGGSGYFYYLTIFINDKGTLKYLTQEEVGDGVVITGLKYSSGEFIVDMITQGEGDDFKGYCCPNVPTTIRFKIKDTALVRI